MKILLVQKSVYPGISAEDHAKVHDAMTEKEQAIHGKPLIPHARVGVRLNLNVLKRTGIPVQSVHERNYSGPVIAYHHAVTLKNVKFNVNQRGREAVASGKENKFPLASVDGQVHPEQKHSTEGVPVRFNPKSGHLFEHAETGEAIKGADEVTVVGHRAYARGKIHYWNESDAPKAKTPSGTKFKQADMEKSASEPACPKCGVVMEWDDTEKKCNRCGYAKEPVLKAVDRKDEQTIGMDFDGPTEYNPEDPFAHLRQGEEHILKFPVGGDEIKVTYNGRWKGKAGVVDKKNRVNYEVDPKHLTYISKAVDRRDHGTVAMDFDAPAPEPAAAAPSVVPLENPHAEYHKMPYRALQRLEDSHWQKADEHARTIRTTNPKYSTPEEWKNLVAYHRQQRAYHEGLAGAMLDARFTHPNNPHNAPAAEPEPSPEPSGPTRHIAEQGTFSLGLARQKIAENDPRHHQFELHDGGKGIARRVDGKMHLTAMTPKGNWRHYAENDEGKAVKVDEGGISTARKMRGDWFSEDEKTGRMVRNNRYYLRSTDNRYLEHNAPTREDAMINAAHTWGVNGHKRRNPAPEPVEKAASEPQCPKCGVVMEWDDTEKKCNRCGCAKEPILKATTPIYQGEYKPERKETRDYEDGDKVTYKTPYGHRKGTIERQINWNFQAGMKEPHYQIKDEHGGSGGIHKESTLLPGHSYATDHRPGVGWAGTHPHAHLDAMHKMGSQIRKTQRNLDALRGKNQQTNHLYPGLDNPESLAQRLEVKRQEWSKYKEQHPDHAAAVENERAHGYRGRVHILHHPYRDRIEVHYHGHPAGVQYHTPQRRSAHSGETEIHYIPKKLTDTPEKHAAMWDMLHKKHGLETPPVQPGGTVSKAWLPALFNSGIKKKKKPAGSEVGRRVVRPTEMMVPKKKPLFQLVAPDPETENIDPVAPYGYRRIKVKQQKSVGMQTERPHVAHHFDPHEPERGWRPKVTMTHPHEFLKMRDAVSMHHRTARTNLIDADNLPERDRKSLHTAIKYHADTLSKMDEDWNKYKEQHPEHAAAVEFERKKADTFVPPKREGYAPMRRPNPLLEKFAVRKSYVVVIHRRK